MLGQGLRVQNSYSYDGQHLRQSEHPVAYVVGFKSVRVDGRFHPQPCNWQEHQGNFQYTGCVGMFSKTMGNLGDGNNENHVIEQIQKADLSFLVTFVRSKLRLAPPASHWQRTN